MEGGSEMSDDVKRFFGSAEGVRARQFPDFTYRFAACVPVEFSEMHTLWGFDRVYPFKDYPRRNHSVASCVSVIPVCERVDFVVEIKEESAEKSVFQVFLLPNKFTAATERKLIFKFHADIWQMPEIRELSNWAADQAFRTHDPR
jgi:hypothetical protein